MVDFCCYSGKLVVELDGGQHYQQIEWDARRTVFLNGEGYRVIRFSDTDALKNTMAFCPLPNPPPRAVEGETRERLRIFFGHRRTVL